MAENTTLARPYAKAIFELAKSSDRMLEWSRTLNFLVEALSTPEMQQLLGSPTIADVQKAFSLYRLFGEPPGEEIRRFIYILAENQRLELLPEVTEDFERRRAEEEKILDVELIAAIQLNDNEVQSFKDALSNRFEQDIELSQTVDPRILGGVVIRAGDSVLDHSLRGKLNKMQEALRRA